MSYGCRTKYYKRVFYDINKVNNMKLLVILFLIKLYARKISSTKDYTFHYIFKSLTLTPIPVLATVLL